LKWKTRNPHAQITASKRPPVHRQGAQPPYCIARGKPVTRLHCCPATTYPVTNRLHPSYTVTSLSISDLASRTGNILAFLPATLLPFTHQGASLTRLWQRQPCPFLHGLSYLGKQSNASPTPKAVAAYLHSEVIDYFRFQPKSFLKNPLAGGSGPGPTCNPAPLPQAAIPSSGPFRNRFIAR